jgi:hypothetical protein
MVLTARRAAPFPVIVGIAIEEYSKTFVAKSPTWLSIHIYYSFRIFVGLRFFLSCYAFVCKIRICNKHNFCCPSARKKLCADVTFPEIGRYAAPGFHQSDSLQYSKRYATTLANIL